MKGAMFKGVMQFLRDLDIVAKCKSEGWNDTSDKVLEAFRGAFRHFIPFQFHPSQKHAGSPNHSLASAAGNAAKRLTAVHDQEAEFRGNDTNNISLRRIRTSRVLPRLATKGVVKTKRKRSTTSMWRQETNFATHNQDSSLTACQSSHTPLINAQLREPPISLNAVHIDAGGHQRTGGSVPDTSRLNRPGINNISALLNQDPSTPVTVSTTTQTSTHGSANSSIELAAEVAGK